MDCKQCRAVMMDTDPRNVSHELRLAVVRHLESCFACEKWVANIEANNPPISNTEEEELMRAAQETFEWQKSQESKDA